MLGGLEETNGYANSFRMMPERIPLLKATDVSLQVLARATSVGRIEYFSD